jgi:hypothetical protein
MSAHPTEANASSTQAGMGLVIAGYVFALCIPIIGLVLGLVAATKHRGAGTNHGIWIVAVAVLSFIGGVAMLAAAGG